MAEDLGKKDSTIRLHASNQVVIHNKSHLIMHSIIMNWQLHLIRAQQI